MPTVVGASGSAECIRNVLCPTNFSKLSTMVLRTALVSRRSAEHFECRSIRDSRNGGRGQYLDSPRAAHHEDCSTGFESGYKQRGRVWIERTPRRVSPVISESQNLTLGVENAEARPCGNALHKNGANSRAFWAGGGVFVQRDRCTCASAFSLRGCTPSEKSYLAPYTRRRFLSCAALQKYRCIRARR
jgi:hypothetical protein